MFSNISIGRLCSGRDVNRYIDIFPNFGDCRFSKWFLMHNGSNLIIHANK